MGRSIGRRYASHHVRGDYDAIIIGSGAGGLSTAAFLAKAGKKVLVLERHYTAGGFTQTYMRKGYEWDVGLHYLGKVHDRQSEYRRVFDYITDSALEWAPIDDCYDRLVFPDRSYDLVAGRSEWIDTLGRSFPQGRGVLRDYLRLVDRVAHSSQNFFMQRALPPLLAPLAYPLMARRFRRYADRTTYEVLRGLTSDERLLGVLGGQYGDYGLPPRRSSFAMHALVAEYYLEGASYPVGGASSVARHIEAVIRRHGGQVLVDGEVEAILLRGDTAIGVRTRAGDEITAPIIVSNVGIHNTLDALLPPRAAMQRVRRGVSRVHKSSGHLCLYVGFRQSPEALGLTSTQRWVFPGYDHDDNWQAYLTRRSAAMPFVWINSASAKDPTWGQRYPGRSTLTALAPAPYEWFSRWAGTGWRERGSEYEELKEQLSQRLLAEIHRQYPQLEGKVDYYELSTPLSTQHFCNRPHGEIFGMEMSPARFQQRWLRPRLPIGNLYLCGQDITTDGVGAATLSGALTASVILGRNVLAKV